MPSEDPNPVICTVEVDYAQPRIGKDRVASIVKGRLTNNEGFSVDGWSSYYFSDTWVNSVTKDLMLKWGPQYEAWRTSNAGIYAKLAKSDFTFTTSSKWDEHEVFGSAGKFIQSAGDTTAEKAITTSAWGENQALYLAWFSFQAGGDNEFEQFRAGFGTDTSATDDKLWFKVYSGGVVEVFWDTELIRQASLGDQLDSSRNPPGGVDPNLFYELMVIPIRGRDVLFYCINRPGGFVVTIPDIEEGTASPSIIRSTDKLWWYSTTGAMKVQLAKMQPATSGYACSVTQHFYIAPLTYSGYDTYVYQDTTSLAAGTATVTLVAQDNTSYAGTQAHRVRVDLTKSGNKSPIVFAAMIEWPTEIVYTDGEEAYELNDRLASATIDVPDSHENQTLSLAFWDPEDAEADGLPLPTLTSSRPIRVKAGRVDGVEYVIFEGVVIGPKFTDSPNPQAKSVQWEARSLWYLIEEYVFEADLPLDGLSLEDGIERILQTCGIPYEQYQISVSGFTIPSIPATSEDFNFACKRNERAGQALNRLIETYAGDWLIVEYPAVDHVVLSVFSQDDLLRAAQWTTYDDRELALTLEADDPMMRFKIYRGYSQEAIEPEANEIWIAGWDLRTKRPIIAHYIDADSQNAEIAPAARPANWLGKRKLYDFRHPMITSGDALSRCMEFLRPRLTVPRMVAQISQEAIFDDLGNPVWRTDCMDLKTSTDHVRGLSRVMSMSIALRLEPKFDEHVGFLRDGRYVVQFIEGDFEGVGASTRTIGTTLAEMSESYRLRTALPKMGMMGERIVDSSPVLFLEVV